MTERDQMLGSEWTENNSRIGSTNTSNFLTWCISVGEIQRIAVKPVSSSQTSVTCPKFCDRTSPIHPLQMKTTCLLANLAGQMYYKEEKKKKKRWRDLLTRKLVCPLEKSGVRGRRFSSVRNSSRTVSKQFAFRLVRCYAPRKTPLYAT